MALISRSIPTLLRGISQSSDATKKPDHADIQDNADSDPVLGLVKRSGSQFVSNLITGETTIGDAKVHMINRDITERYVVIFTTNNVRVFDLAGTEIDVIKPDGVTYLSCTTPRSQIKTITIADYTFVVNTTVTTAMDSTLSTGGNTQAIVFFNQVSDATIYSVTVDGTTVSKNTSSDNPLSTSTVATSIKSQLDAALTGFTIAQNGPVLHIKKNDNSDFSVDSTDTQGNSQITTVKNAVQQFTDLPTVSPDGMVVEIKGDDSTNFDNYYVKFVTNNGGAFEEGQWQECAAPGIQFKFNYSTMPHVLLRQANGKFRFARVDGGTYALSHPTSATYSQSGTTVTVTSSNHGFSVGNTVDIIYSSGTAVSGDFTIVSVADANTFTYTAATSLSTSGNATFGVPTYGLPIWGERLTGDLESAKNPSFIGAKINNVFFFRNRLGFLANDNVILSTVSKFFEFFPETVLTVIDSDPIDVAASHTKVAILKNAVNMGEKLILFSDQTQFVLSSSADNLTPKTANVLVATEFESSDAATPVGAGSSIYYLTSKGSFAGLREYITQSGVDVKDAANLTIHVPRLLPNDIYRVAISTNEDILILLGASNSNKLYVNKWLYGAKGEKILNSWFTYTFEEGRAIKNIDFIGSDLFIVTEDIVQSENITTEVNLEKIPFEPDFKEENSTYEFHLDRKITESSTGVSITYDTSTKLSSVTVPYRLDTNMDVITRDLAPAVLATYSSTTSNNTVTITKTNHGFITDDQVEVVLPIAAISNFANPDVEFIAEYVALGNGFTGKFLITKVDDNTFTLVGSSNLGTTSSTVCSIRESSYLIDDKGIQQNNFPGQQMPALNSVGGNQTIFVVGDVRRTKFIIGEPYEMHYRFAQQRLTESPTQGNELISGRLQIKHFYLKFEDTGFIKVEVTPDNNTTSTYEFTSVLGSDNSILNDIKLETGTFKVPVMSRADRVTVDVKNITYLPTKLTSAEYEAMFYMRSNRR